MLDAARYHRSSHFLRTHQVSESQAVIAVNAYDGVLEWVVVDNGLMCWQMLALKYHQYGKMDSPAIRGISAIACCMITAVVDIVINVDDTSHVAGPLNDNNLLGNRLLDSDATDDAARSSS